MGYIASKPADPAIGRRGRSRLRARLPAQLVSLDGTINTVVLDLSVSGARAKAGEATHLGQTVVLIWAGYDAFGKIVWVEHGLCGIVFDEPLSPAALVAARELEQLPSDREMERNRVREWVDGARRV